jgi:hypothetical protein
MKHAELFRGFDEKKQAEYEQQLIERFGEGMREGIAESRRRVKDWTKSDWHVQAMNGMRSAPGWCRRWAVNSLSTRTKSRG